MSISGINIICAIFERVEGNMLPALDLDNDYFGTLEVSKTFVIHEALCLSVNI